MEGDMKKTPANYIKLILKKQYYADCLRRIKVFYKQVKPCFKRAYRIEQINISEKTILLYCNGIRSIMKLTLAEAVGDPLIILNLSPQQACRIGYYYGWLYWEATNRNETACLPKKGTFKLRQRDGRFKIISQERNGNITYFDSKTNKARTESPPVIFLNEFVISQLDSSQACYVGIQTGLIVAKSGENIFLQPKKPILNIVLPP